MAATRPTRAAAQKTETTTLPKKAAATKKQANTKAKADAPAKAAPKKTSAKDDKSTKSTTTKATPKSAIAKSDKITKEKTAKAAAKTEKVTPNKAAAVANISKKRKAEDAQDERPTKKSVPSKAVKKLPAINQPPTDVVQVLVFGEGSAGELGLGTEKNAVDVKRPRVNANLEKAGVVDLAAGGMHAIALTQSNTILTWGVNDTGALGRDTTWDGGLRDLDADEDSDDEDSGLNPHEATPAAVELPEARWVKVVAGDSCSLALTDDGRVYGWGTFRSNEGPFGFTSNVEVATRPIQLDLKNIVDIACGANHALAVNNKGIVYAWGAGEQNQLGRRVVKRNERGGLVPREVEMPRAAKHKIKKVESGQYHSFAITHNDEVYAWGLNSFGQTGVDSDAAGEDSAIIANAQHVKSLAGKHVVSIAGGSHHSIAATQDGECLVWGRVDGGQTGIPRKELEALGDVVQKNERGQLALLPVPTKVQHIKGHANVVSAGTEHSLVVTKEGKVYSTGFSANYQTGLGTTDDVFDMTLIDNTAARDRVIVGASAGGQYSIITAKV